MGPATVVGTATLGATCGPWLRAVIRRYVAAADGSGRRGRLGPSAGSVEAGTAAVFAALAIRVDSAPLLAALCWFALAGVALAAVDVAEGRLPDALTGTAGGGLLVGLVVVAVVRDQEHALYRALLAALGLFAGYLALALVSPASLGFGDCKLAAGLGAALGWFSWPVVFAGTLVAFGLAGGFGLCLVALGRVGRRDPIPFGPFMLLGALVAVLVG
ncbi:MAG TPA: A24 family peptidase [Mycobacteriales bacterium]|nr:A24 family peptidase [Mycobacteriales bacterium]